ncbi:MAG: nucleotide exchange factor GrpE [Parachlamydiales bacterium]
MSNEQETNEEGPKSISELELESLRKEAAEYKDKYFRAIAEAENSRKRMGREQGERTQHAIAEMLRDFLRPLDQLENALAYAEKGSPEVANWAHGFQMIVGQFRQVLESHGITPFASEGKHFDPHHHEAIEMVETEEHPEGTILEELVKGYRMGERTLRPAQVKVAKAPTKSEEQGERHEQEEKQ